MCRLYLQTHVYIKILNEICLHVSEFKYLTLQDFLFSEFKRPLNKERYFITAVSDRRSFIVFFFINRPIESGHDRAHSYGNRQFRTRYPQFVSIPVSHFSSAIFKKCPET